MKDVEEQKKQKFSKIKASAISTKKFINRIIKKFPTVSNTRTTREIDPIEHLPLHVC